MSTFLASLQDIDANFSMPRVIVALGSNAGDEQLLLRCRQMLEQLLTDTRHTAIIRTSPIGMEGDDFLNSLTCGETTLDSTSLVAALKQMERRCGDRRSLRALGKVVMDIDLLQYDDERHHPYDWQRDYIQELIRQL